MTGPKELELLQFDKIVELISKRCFSEQARRLCSSLQPTSQAGTVIIQLLQTAELKDLLAAGGFFPPVDHNDISTEIKLLSLEGAFLHEDQLVKILMTTGAVNTMVRFLQSKKTVLPQLSALSAGIDPPVEVSRLINAILDHEGKVLSSASPELSRIRKQVALRRRESDQKFNSYVAQLRKLGYLRENEEGFFNGRRTLAVIVEYKNEVPGFVHDKSESGRTIFIEPGATIAINNEIAELELDEKREVNRILRELCNEIRPFAPTLQQGQQLLVQVDFIKAKAVFAVDIKGILPTISDAFSLDLRQAVHPLLYLHNKTTGKRTIPLSLELNHTNRLLVISGPNAGGKTIALKTVGLLVLMLQSGLLIPVDESSSLGFFESVMADIGDAQSLENELSTYSGKLRRMTAILEKVNDGTLILIDEFGSGTDPDLGSAIAEAVLESLVASQTRGIITSHFGNVKVLADKLAGAVNGSMLYDIETLEPKYMLSIGQPGSSYTFEVAEKTGFPKYLIERARKKVDRDKLKLAGLLSEVQDQKVKLEEQRERSEHEAFLSRMAKEKYQALFNSWEEKIGRERDQRTELARLADYGKRYVRLMDEWNLKQDRKALIKRFIDGITAETKKQEVLRRENKHDVFAERKIAMIKPKLKIGMKVRVLNSNNTGTVEEIRDEKAVVKMGIMKITVGMENLAIAED
jgi:DNA mismatch repair protein MutS2